MTPRFLTRQHGSHGLLSIFIFYSTLTLSINVSAKIGDPDKTFGDGNGWQFITPFAYGVEDEPQSALRQADGKLVLLGYHETIKDAHGQGRTYYVARFNADGSLDTGFATAGLREFEESVSLSSVLQQPDGKLLLTGQQDDAMLLVRLDDNGEQDAAFGIGGEARQLLTGGPSNARKVVFLPDDKLMVLGTIVRPRKKIVCFASICAENTADKDLDTVLVRFNADGLPDDSFANGGVLIIDNNSVDDFPVAGLYVPDGNVLVVSNNDMRHSQYCGWVLNIPPDGVPGEFALSANTFCRVGDERTVAESLQLADDETVVLSGYSGVGENRQLLNRTLRVDGTINRDVEESRWPLGETSDKRPAVKMTDGSLLVAVYKTVYRYEPGAAPQVLLQVEKSQQIDGVIALENGNFMLYGDVWRELPTHSRDTFFAMYTATGEPVKTFGENGIVYHNARLMADTSAEALYATKDGKWLQVGTTTTPECNRVVLARYLANGQPDTSLDDDGMDYLEYTSNDSCGTLVDSLQLENSSLLFALNRPPRDDYSTFYIRRVVGGSFTPAGEGDVCAMGQQPNGNFIVLSAKHGGYRQEQRLDLGALKNDQYGYSDKSFGDEGAIKHVLTDTETPCGARMKVQRDGRIVLGMPGFLRRYQTDGQPDDTFGTSSQVGLPAYADSQKILSIHQQADGNLLVMLAVPGTGNRQDIHVLRYLPDGSVDDSYGDEGDRLLADGIAAGIEPALFERTSGGWLAAWLEADDESSTLIMQQQDVSGAIDPAFGNDGVSTTPFPAQAGYVTTVLQQPDGKLVLGGSARKDGLEHFFIARVDSDEANTDGDELMDRIDDDDDNDLVPDTQDNAPLDASIHCGYDFICYWNLVKLKREKGFPVF